MRTITSIFLLSSQLLILTSNLSFAEYEIDCGWATTPRDISNCAANELDKANKELFALWGVVNEYVEKYQSPQLNFKRHRKALKVSQRAWLKFRKAQCDWAAYNYEEATAVGMVEALCMASMTRERIKYFKDFLTQQQEKPLMR